MRMSPDRLPKQILYSQLPSGHRKRVPYQRSLISLTFSCILVTPSCFLMSTLFTLSLSVTPLILRNILISVFSRICSFFLSNCPTFCSIQKYWSNDSHVGMRKLIVTVHADFLTGRPSRAHDVIPKNQCPTDISGDVLRGMEEEITKVTLENSSLKT